MELSAEDIRGHFADVSFLSWRALMHSDSETALGAALERRFVGSGPDAADDEGFATTGFANFV